MLWSSCASSEDSIAWKLASRAESQKRHLQPKHKIYSTGSRVLHVVWLGVRTENRSERATPCYLHARTNKVSLARSLLICATCYGDDDENRLPSLSRQPTRHVVCSSLRRKEGSLAQRTNERTNVQIANKICPNGCKKAKGRKEEGKA